VARASPSLSQSSGVGSPIIATNPTSAPSGGQQQLSKIAVAQLFLVIGQFEQEKDKVKRERHAESIAKVTIFFEIPSPADFANPQAATRLPRHGSLLQIPSPVTAEQCASYFR
jgi:hypothetical protein